MSSVTGAGKKRTRLRGDVREISNRMDGSGIPGASFDSG